MALYTVKQIISQGIAAAKTGNRREARQYFEAVISHDENNVIAWWWLAQVLENQKERSKCLEKTREVAVQSDENLATYRTILEQSGAPELSRYKLAKNSRSTGDMCPVCTLTMEINDIVAICPTCHRAHHSECWEDNAFHCGNFACSGSGVIAHSGSVTTEPAASEKTVSIDSEEIPDESPWKTREEQEKGFMNRLRHRAAEMMAARVIHQIEMEARAEARRQAREEWVQRQREARAREEAQRQRELINRTVSAFFAGLIPGVILAVAAFQYSQNWAIAVFSAYLAATSISTAAAHAMRAKDRLTSTIYWLLPKVGAAVIVSIAFGQWESGLRAVILAFVGDLLLNRIQRFSPIYERRAFIAYSTLALAVIGVLRAIFG